MFVDAPTGTSYIDAWVGELAPVRLDRQPDGSFGKQVAITDVPAGTQQVLLAADGSTTAFAKITFHRSAPYYVLVSTDWDFSDPGDQVIAYQNQMHTKHPELRITHFVGPYTFTDPVVTADRQATLVSWLLEQRDTHGDEIGLHIHPYCNFVVHAGLTCITDQSTVDTMDLTGYTIKLGAYDRAQEVTLLTHAGDLFEQHGLNRPKTFRAGGWTATIDTFNALADTGFVADTSALNWAKVDEWKNVGNKELYRWNMEHWLPITDDSQPYYPNHDDPLAMTAPTLSILQAPDNGAMVDYVGVSEMVDILAHNWDGGPLARPTVFSYGFHPSENFSASEQARVDGMAYKLDQALASADLGPVVYTVLRDLPKAFPAP